ncbi:hypothetical protein BASA81_007534 [Batrachochytrium salamandrivorans]|nr:hypothetical protein BASA81_007534 [Batrachochytrium salamandrivorans]
MEASLLFAALCWVACTRRDPTATTTTAALPRVIEETLTCNADAQWLQLKLVKYLDQNGVERTWEKVERVNSTPGVLIACTIVGGPRHGYVPFVKQFRPCVNAYTLELPAGLVDVGETFEQAAIRELEEETGLVHCQVKYVSPLLFLDPGVSSCSAKFVIAEVDGTKNLNPKQKLGVGEFCEMCTTLV